MNFWSHFFRNLEISSEKQAGKLRLRGQLEALLLHARLTCCQIKLPRSKQQELEGSTEEGEGEGENREESSSKGAENNLKRILTENFPELGIADKINSSFHIIKALNILTVKDTMHRTNDSWVLCPQEDIFITLPALKEHHGRGDTKNVRAERWGELIWNAVFWTLHGHCA